MIRLYLFKQPVLNTRFLYLPAQYKLAFFNTIDDFN